MALQKSGMFHSAFMVFGNKALELITAMDLWLTISSVYIDSIQSIKFHAIIILNVDMPAHQFIRTNMKKHDS